MTKLEQAYQLIRDNHAEDARKLLKELLVELPRNAEVSALLAHITANDFEHKLHLPEVVAHANDDELANWARQRLGAVQGGQPNAPQALPPIKFVSIDEASTANVREGIEEALPSDSQPVKKPVPTTFVSPPNLEDKLAQRDLFGMSLTKLGVWITLVGGLILVLAVYVPPVLFFFLRFGIPILPCSLFLTVIGGTVIAVGLVQDRKKKPKYH